MLLREICSGITDVPLFDYLNMNPMNQGTFSAIQTAADNGHTHILEDVGKNVSLTHHADLVLAKAFSSFKLETAKFVFNDLLRSCFDPEALPRAIATQGAALDFAEAQFAKVLNVKKGVNIDWSLAAEQRGGNRLSRKSAPNPKNGKKLSMMR